MAFQRGMVLTALCIFCLSTTTYALSSRTRPTSVVKPPVIINVGITEYSKIQSTYNNYERLFSELAASADKNDPVTFKFAVGTYGEVLDWYNKGIIEVAILSAMPTADLLIAKEAANLDRAYIGDLSVSRPRSPQSIVGLFKERSNDPYIYQSGAIFLQSDTVLREIAKEPDPFPKLTQLWNDGQLQFLFVRPYSLSGYIVPITTLKQNGIDLLKAPAQLKSKHFMDFTYDHGQSLNRLTKTPDAAEPPHKIAFVLDDTRYNPQAEGCTPLQPIPTEQILARIKMKGLDLPIPREVILANYNQEREEVTPAGNKFTRTKALMERVLKNWVAKIESHSLKRAADPNAPVIKFRSRPELWREGYKGVTELLAHFSTPRELLNKSTLDDLMSDLVNSKVPPRLALVLSGGGAKCAYQAGAIVEIEKRLQEETAKRQERVKCDLKGKPAKEIEDATNAIARKLDIHLVVGTSGGAINALLVAMKATQTKSARSELVEAWKSFKQQQFLKPPTGFRYLFGIGFAVFQTLIITVAVILFGKQTMDWKWTLIVLALFGCLEFVPAFYFLPREKILQLYLIEAILLLAIIALVLVFNLFLIVIEKFLRRKANTPPADTSMNQEDPHRWRKLAILLLAFFGTLEALIAVLPGTENFVEYLPNNHWVDHGWTLVLLVSTWSYPFPFVIALMMLLLGWQGLRGFEKFNWLKWRASFLGWTAIVLSVIAVMLVLDGLFRERSPSTVSGIEQAFIERFPAIIRKTVGRNLDSPAEDQPQRSLELMSSEIMMDQFLQRDLVITSSKLPATETDETGPLPVNSLPSDLYFYYRFNQDATLTVPPDKSFVSLKRNPNRLLDVVIGSSTIYPIFPARLLQKIQLGTDEHPYDQSVDMRIIDGGFTHNIPIEAARLWKATHIIVIEASPAEQHDPRYFLDHALTAFGYLFAQAQRADTLGSKAEAFLLRPTSECDKSNIRSVCTEIQPDGKPDPDMDTFDFSPRAAQGAFDKGSDDVKSFRPLFVRIPGEPHFQDVTLKGPRN
jgi:predicted acylesterase/phospholipase RssA